MKKICFIILCLIILCSCKTKPLQTNDNVVQDELDKQDIVDIYDLSVFDDLPKNYSDINPNFWMAESSNGAKVYILGSIHCADTTVYRLPQPIMDAYLSSDALAVEVDIVAYDNNIDSQQADIELTTYSNGDSLKNHISPDMYSQLVNFIENNTNDNQLLESIENRKPCVWLSVLTDIDSKAAGLYAEYGIDEHFLKLAHAQNKEIIEIESSTSQYEALNRISDTAYEMLFCEYIYQAPEQLGEVIKYTYEEWKSGTLQKTIEVDDDIFTTSELSEEVKALIDYERIIYTERNEIMIQKIESLLEEGRSVFCVVGADHLLGNTGIISKLEQDGYKLTQLNKPVENK